MAYFARTTTGHINIDAVAHIHQQLGGEYRIRWIDGTVQTITGDDGDAVMKAIQGDMDRVINSARNKAIEIFKAEQAQVPSEVNEKLKHLEETEPPKRKTRTTKKTA